nr:MAG TPA: hypothetical protein [Caudoviricetes sp.]
MYPLAPPFIYFPFAPNSISIRIILFLQAIEASNFRFSILSPLYHSFIYVGKIEYGLWVLNA